MRKNTVFNVLSVCAIVLSVCAISMHFFIRASDKPSEDKAYRDVLNKHLHHFSAPIPETLTFCGEQIPLDNVFVREALDRELTSIMYQHSVTFMVLKRAWRFMPDIEKDLKSLGAPDDLKYLAVAESALADVVSPAKAAGFWQFMPATAKKYGMEVNDEWDERYDLDKSTVAAVEYLKNSYRRFGSWTLACAAYNCGENGLASRLKQQNCNSYWELSINTETSRYVYRILAYKILMENPKQYGFYVRKKDCHQPLEYDVVTIDTTINDMIAFSKQIGYSSYKYFRMMNPTVRSNRLTNKSRKKYSFKVLKPDSYSWKYLVSKLKDKEEFMD